MRPFEELFVPLEEDMGNGHVAKQARITQLARSSALAFENSGRCSRQAEQV
jgi:hypothetical protein